jgi:hypothetical protein
VAEIKISRHIAEVKCNQVLLDFLYDILNYQSVILKTECPNESVIIVSNYNDKNGQIMADYMIEWEKLKTLLDKGETPVAIGLLSRDEAIIRLGLFDPESAAKLKTMKRLSIIVISNNIAIVSDMLI